MLCYRDRVYCDNPRCTCPPSRRLTEQVKEAARRWWKDCEGEPPIATADLCGAKLNPTQS